MFHLVGAVRAALASGNQEAALFMALALPDVCASLESDDGKTTGRKYMAWFDRFMAANYVKAVGAPQLGRISVFLSASDCYALRCALLHQGSSDISDQRAQEVLDRIHFTVSASGRGSHLTKFNSVLLLDAGIFCEQVCAAVDGWLFHFLSTRPDRADRLGQLVKVHRTA